MRIALVEDGLSFDSASAAERPLGGPERALIGLADALALAGHSVKVYNRCAMAATLGKVDWMPLPADPTKGAKIEADVLVAWRKPALLAAAPKDAVGRRILWSMAAPEHLLGPDSRDLLEKFTPRLVYLSQAQRARSPFTGADAGVVVPPGVGKAFTARPSPGMPPEGPPTAVITTHPMNGLDYALSAWANIIHPAVPEARLVIVSALLAQAAEGAELPSALSAVWQRTQDLADKGVEVHPPGDETTMADLYRQARVHLYPGHEDDMACWTLGESQACGLPAVVRPLGATEERISNGETGYVIPDAEAFGNVAVQLLSNDPVFQGQAEQAAQPHRRRSWIMAARDFELLCA
ncbi:MAG: glycosyltransferase [Rhodospirillaceae bacterium]